MSRKPRFEIVENGLRAGDVPPGRQLHVLIKRQVRQVNLVGQHHVRVVQPLIQVQQRPLDVAQVRLVRPIL